MFRYNISLGIRIFFFAPFVYFLLTVFVGELRFKVIKITINGDQIVKSGFGGLGRKYYFSVGEIEGYKTSYISSKSRAYEYLYLMKGNEKLIKVSEYYHLNYKDLKIEILKKGIKNLGIEQWSLLSEVKEVTSLFS